MQCCRRGWPGGGQSGWVFWRPVSRAGQLWPPAPSQVNLGLILNFKNDIIIMLDISDKERGRAALSILSKAQQRQILKHIFLGRYLDDNRHFTKYAHIVLCSILLMHIKPNRLIFLQWWWRHIILLYRQQNHLFFQKRNTALGKYRSHIVQQYY